MGFKESAFDSNFHFLRQRRAVPSSEAHISRTMSRMGRSIGWLGHAIGWSISGSFRSHLGFDHGVGRVQAGPIRGCQAAADGAMVASVDPETGAHALQALSSLTAETSSYVARTLPEVQARIRTVPKKAGRAELERAFADIREIARPIVEHVLTFGERIRSQLEQAFAVEEIVPLGDAIWSAAFLTVDRARTNVQFCDVFRAQAKQVREAAVLWPSEWSERYDAILDAFEDYSETIALGLDPAVRREIEARRAELSPT